MNLYVFTLGPSAPPEAREVAAVATVLAETQSAALELLLDDNQISGGVPDRLELWRIAFEENATVTSEASEESEAGVVDFTAGQIDQRLTQEKPFYDFVNLKPQAAAGLPQD